MISDRIKQLIRQAEQSKEAEEFWQEVNELAEKYEVPVDYILHEFY
jgi:pyruvate-formate lyase